MGLTQEKASGIANLSLRYWQSLESGEKNLTLDALVRIARVLQVEIKDLVS